MKNWHNTHNIKKDIFLRLKFIKFTYNITKYVESEVLNLHFDNFLKRFNEDYHILKNTLIDLSLGFDHELLKDNDYIIYYDKENELFGIVFFENGYYYEANLDMYNLKDNKNIQLDDFKYVKSESWDLSTVISDYPKDDIVKLKSKKIASSYIEHFINHEHFRLKFLYKENVLDMLNNYSFNK